MSAKHESDLGSLAILRELGRSTGGRRAVLRVMPTRAACAAIVVLVAAASCRSEEAFSDTAVEPAASGNGGSSGRAGGRGGSGVKPASGSGGATGGSEGAGVGMGGAVAGATGEVTVTPAGVDAAAAGGGGGSEPSPPPPPIDANVVPEAPPARHALFVIGTPQPVGTDITVRDRLAAQLMVDVVVDMQSTTASADGKALVVISSSTILVNVESKFNDVAVPVLLLEPNLMPGMQLTAAPNTAHGGTTAETQLALVGNGHPLHAGLSGTVTVFTSPGHATWGVPGPAATKIAALVSRPTQLAIFAYPAGAMMVGRTAPAKRLAFFIQDNPTENLAPDGIKLLDAAITWLLQ